MTLDELNKLVRDTVTAITGVSEVIRYYPNAPRPANAYSSVNISELTRIGMRDISYITNGNDLDEKVVMLYEAMVSVNFYREDARQNAGVFAGMLLSNPILDSFNAVGVGFIRPSTVRDIALLQDAGHEERAQVDVFLQFELTPKLESVIGIDTVNVTGDIDNGTEVVETVDLAIGSTP